MNMKITARTGVALYMTALLFSGNAMAGLCMSGKIKSLKLSNNSSNFFIEPTGTIHNTDLYRDGRYIDIWQKNSYSRWNEKYGLIKLAYAMDSKVEVYSSDYNCMGPEDEFTIELKQ